MEYSIRMARRTLDRIPGQRRGQEQLCEEIWEHRVDLLVEALKETPMDAQTTCKHFFKTMKWPSLYTINVIAAADIDGKIQTIDNKWHSIE